MRLGSGKAQQGMFDEMVDVLFLRQDDWSGLADPTSTFEQYASDLGRNVGQVPDAGDTHSWAMSSSVA